MEKPFSADSSPFLTPYPPPSPDVPGIKPFPASDSAPPFAQTAPRLNPPPQASPFLERHSDKAFPGLAAAPPAPRGGFPLGSIPGSIPGAFPASQPGAVPPPVVPGLIGAEPAPFGGLPPPPSARPPFPVAPSVVPTAAAPISVPIVTPAAPPILPSAPASPAAAAPVMTAPTAMQPDSPALRASATPRRGSGTEAYPKSALTMTDADSGAEAPGMVMTTGPNIEGRRIKAYLGVVSVEIVIPKDVLFRNPAPYGELHRIKDAEEHLQRIKRKAFEELTAKARALGADGLVGTTLQFSQFDTIVCLCAAMGTAVKID